MSSAWSSTAPGRRAAPTRPGRRHVDPPGREGDVLGAAPRDEDRVRSDDTVVAEPAHRGGMDLEVEMRRPSFGVAGVTDETDHVARLHARSLDRERRVRGEVGVVELVPEVVPQPEPVATELDEADRVDRRRRRRRGAARPRGRRCPLRGASPRGSPVAGRRSCPRTRPFRRSGTRSRRPRAAPSPRARREPGRPGRLRRCRARAPSGSEGRVGELGRGVGCPGGRGRAGT